MIKARNKRMKEKAPRQITEEKLLLSWQLCVLSESIVHWIFKN